jgi:hypothetical protein
MWTCDYCGGEIATAEEGWVEWLVDTRGQGYGLRLVHQWRSGQSCFCTYEGQGSDNFRDHHLNHFISNGTARLREYGPNMEIAVLDAAIAAGLPKKKKSVPAAKRDPDHWEEDDHAGLKRQRLVRWLMSAPRRVPLDKARIIAARKYPD